MEDNRIASQYYREVGGQPIPTAEQERDLFTRYRTAMDTGNRGVATRLRHQIACGYLKFVVQRAHRRTKNPEIRLELIAEGNIGLMTAIDKFDVALGNRFLTYAAPWIEVFMREHINRSLPVHMPNHKRKDLRRKRAEEDKLIALGQLRDYTEVEPAATSIDNVTVAVPDTVEEEVQQRETNVLAFMESAGLSMRERFVVVHYYGLRGGEGRNFRDLAAQFYLVDGSCLTDDVIRGMLEDATGRLNRYLTSIGLRSVSEAL